MIKVNEANARAWRDVRDMAGDVLDFYADDQNDSELSGRDRAKTINAYKRIYDLAEKKVGQYSK